MSTVLVTGGSGFIGSYIILQLLSQGHQVRATLRSLKREEDVRAMLKAGGVEPGDRLSFYAASLEQDQGWDVAVQGCDYVLHVASPFPASAPADENEIIAPARDGTLRVLRASRDAGVKRVVVTSSFAAVGYGKKPQKAPFTEQDWTDPDSKGIQPYIKSKTVAERAAWDFVAREGGKTELAVVNPVGVFGPVLGPKLSSSIDIIKRMMDGEMPRVPELYFGAVDVRDVADLHLRAMLHPAAKGERFICVAGASLSLLDVAKILRNSMGQAADRTPTRQIPKWLLRLAAIRNPAFRAFLPDIGNRKSSSNEKANTVLGWTPRSNEEAIAATGESLVRLGLLKGQE